jgi:TctA family transporter
MAVLALDRRALSIERFTFCVLGVYAVNGSVVDVWIMLRPRAAWRLVL